MRRIVLSLAGLLALVAGLGVARASEPQAPAPPFTELEVVEQGFQSLGDAGIDIGIEVRWGVLAHNPNPDTWVAGAGTVDVTFRDVDGNVVGTDFGNVGLIGPGETQAIGSQTAAYLSAEPSTMTVQSTIYEWFDKADLGPGEISGTIVSDDLTPDGSRHVVAALRSTLVTDAWVDPNFVLRDTNGTLLGVFQSHAVVPAGAEVGTDAVFYRDVEMPSAMTVEVDIDWSQEVGGFTERTPPAGVLPLEVVEVGGGWYSNTLGTASHSSWGAIIRNPNGDGWVAQDVAINTTFRAADGQITGADFANFVADALGPGQTMGVGTGYTVAPESANIEVIAIASWAKFDVVPESPVTFDDVSLQYGDDGSPAVTATMTVPEELFGGSGIRIGVIYRDAAGQIIGGTWYVEFADATTSSIEISSDTVIPDIASVELFANRIIDPEQPSAPAAGTGQFRPSGTFSPEVAANIPAPSDVSTDPPVVYANLILAALAVLALTIGVRLLNTTLVAHEDALEGFIRPAKALGAWWGHADKAVAGRMGRASEVVRIGGVLLFYGVLFSFLEPGWRPWTVSGLFVLVVMTIAFGAVGTGDDLVELRSARRWGLPARLVVKPALVLFAVGSVALTKFAGLVPGLLIGTPEAFSMEDEVSERDEARLAVVGLGSTAAIGLGAWALATPFDRMLDGSGGFGQGASSALVTVLVLIFAVAVENLFANLLAFPGSEGAALRRRSRVGWWITMLAVTALFFHTLINPSGDLGESLRGTNVRVVLITVAAFLLFAVSVWLWFRRRDRQQPPPGAGPTARDHATPQPTTGAEFAPPDGTPIGLPPPVPREVVHH